MAYDVFCILFSSNSFKYNTSIQNERHRTGVYVLFDFLYMRSDKISGNYRPPNVPKYILPNTYITCIFEKLFFLFKGTGCYKNRLIQFPYTGLIFEKLISQDFRPY